MLTPADKALWCDFFAALTRRRPALEADDMLPMLVLFAPVRARNDDAALVAVEPGEVRLLTPPGPLAHDVAAMLEAAAALLREGGPHD